MQACHIFLQLGEPAAAQINGQKKAKIAFRNLIKSHAVKLMNDHENFTTMQLCARGGARTPQGYIKHMIKYHSNSKFPQLLVSVLLHHIHLLLCAVENFDRSTR